MNKILILCIMTALMGCTTTPQAKVKVPASLTQKCQPLYEVEGITGKDLLKNITMNAEVYHRCSDMHDALIKAVK